MKVETGECQLSVASDRLPPGEKHMIVEKHSIDLLSAGQRDCLRLVYQHKSSKEIARELDISPHTVDQRLRVAMRKLGVNNRKKAALMFATASDDTVYQSLRYQSPQIAAAISTPHDRTRNDQARNRGGKVEHVLREQQQPYAVFSDAKPSGSRFSLPGLGGRANDLTILEKLAWIVGISFAAALSYGAIISGLEALSRYS